MTRPDDDRAHLSGGDDSVDLYALFIDRLSRHEGREARALGGGRVEILLDRPHGPRRVEVHVSRERLSQLLAERECRQQDALGEAEDDDEEVDDTDDGRLWTVVRDVELSLAGIRELEHYVVLDESGAHPWVRPELPPLRARPSPEELRDPGFWSAFPEEHPRFGEPGSILGHRPGGETDLTALLTSMSPVLQDGRFVFCTTDTPPDRVDPVVTVREAEGVTLVIEQHQADELGLHYDFVAAMVTLRVHSALGAVGLTAAVSGTLATRGISCNVVAGYFHDHLFVPHDRGFEVLDVLEDLREAPPQGF